MTSAVLINDCDVFDVLTRLILARTRAVTGSIVQGTFTKTLKVICTAIIIVVFAVVVIKSCCTSIRGCLVKESISRDLGNLYTLSY